MWICVLFALAVVGSCEEQPVDRQGRFFDSSFWDGLERGLSRTADQVVNRVRDNLEVAFDQLASTFDSSSRLSDVIEDRVQESLPPFLRLSPPNRPIEAVVGNVGGDGVDDGLKVYYEGDSIDRVDAAPGLESNREPRPEGDDTELVTPASKGNDYDDVDYGLGFHGFLNPLRPWLPFGGGIQRPSVPGMMIPVSQWWKGPNVCVDREEVDEAERDVSKNSSVTNLPSGGFVFGFIDWEYTSCDEAADKYTCVTKTSKRDINKTVKIIYRCCHGFVRDVSGCVKVDVRPVSEALEQIDADDFLTLLKSAGLVDRVKEKNMTLFVPTNEAIQEFTEDLQEKNELVAGLAGSRAQNEVFRRRRSTHELSPILLSHMVEGLVYAGDMKDEQILQSENEKSTIRINTYSSFPPTLTANCARVVKANQHATNAAIHTIDRVMKPVTQSVGEILNNDPRFTILIDLIRKTELEDLLSKEGQFTIFAPTDEAFRSLPSSTLEAFLAGNRCLEAILKNHILQNVICTAAIQGKARTLNLLKDYIFVERNENDDILVQDAKMVDRDIVGTNGVIHVISKPLLPEEAKPVLELLEGHNLTRFIELLEAADMDQELQKMEDITVFAPSNEAIGSIPEDEMNALMGDKEKLRTMLKYHMTNKALEADDITNNHLADTHAGHPLRINLYSSVPLFGGFMGDFGQRPMRLTAGCSRLSVLNSRACGAVVHVTEDILRVPEDTVMKKLNQSEEYSIFRKMVEDVGLSKTLTSDGPFTVLAPSDHVFRILPEEEVKAIMEDQEIKESIVKKHILNEHLCCSGINPNTWPFMDRKRTLDGSAIHVRRTGSGRLMADRSRITKCGSPAHNGVVHTVNSIMINMHPTGQQDEFVSYSPKNTLQLLFG